MRKPNKASLGKALTKNSSTTHLELAEKSKYVLDGGALIRRVLGIFLQLVMMIPSKTAYILKGNNGKATQVVFDGYNSSTKDHEH